MPTSLTDCGPRGGTNAELPFLRLPLAATAPSFPLSAQYRGRASTSLTPCPCPCHGSGYDDLEYMQGLGWARLEEIAEAVGMPARSNQALLG